MRCWAVVPAAGSGLRMKADRPKQYLELLGRTVIEHSVLRLAAHPAIERIVVALAPEDPWWPGTELAADSRVLTVTGGAERADSVLNGLDALADVAHADDWVFVHDAARPCVHASDLNKLLTAATDNDSGAILAVPVTDTVKQAGESGSIAGTLDRSCLWRAFTPQLFQLERLRNALWTAHEAGQCVTDEASAIELAGDAPSLVEGRADNIKITRPGDLALAEFFMQQQEKLQ